MFEVKPRRVMETQQRGLAELNGVGLAWARSGPRGNGVPAVVLAHGLTDAAACWDRVAETLSL